MHDPQPILAVENVSTDTQPLKVVDDVRFDSLQSGLCDLDIVGTSETTGTFIRFKADAEIFTETTVYEFETLERRLREQAFLNAGLSISLTDKRNLNEENGEVYCYEGGISSFVDFETKKRGLTPLHEEPIHFSAVSGDREANIALM